MLRYSRAYLSEEVAAFTPVSDWLSSHASEGPVFLWDDLSLTADPFADEPAYRDDSELWQRFCREQLGFAVPADVG